MSSILQIPKRYLRQSSINNLDGRVVQLPAQSKKQTPILLVYGHHSSLERMYSIARAFNEFGPVTMPDLPGFGGMPSLHLIKQKPTIDNLADYLAEFIQQNYSNDERFRIVAMSLGFVITVRMLQKHPQLVNRVEGLVSMVGFVHYENFAFPKHRRKLLRHTAKFMARPLIARAFAGVALRKPVIASVYHLRAKTHPKMKGFSFKQRQKLIDFEVTLWKSNEIHTYFTLTHELLTLDLTKHKLDLPVHHIAVASDQYFNNDSVAKYLAQIFTNVITHTADMPNHAPTVIDDIRSARRLIPETLAETFFASTRNKNE